MTGSGTQADPYIITTWEELIDTTNRTTTDFCEWDGGNVDLNDIKPEGYTNSVVINGIIDFKDATIKNLRTIAGSNTPIVFAFGADGYVKNLNLLNCFFTGSFYSAIHFPTANYGINIEKLRLGVFIDPTSTSGTRFLTTDNGMNFRRCSFAFDCNTQTEVYVTSSRYINFYDCQFDFDIKSKDGYDVIAYTDFKCNVYHSRIKGRYIGQTEATKQFTGFNNHSNVYLFDEGSYTTNSQGISVYNSDTCTITGTNVKGCTSAQLSDTAYLKSIGFAIGD